MKLTAKVLTLLILAAIGLAACQPAAPPQPGLAGTEWILTTLFGEPVEAGLVTAEVGAENQISGSAGCNQYRANYDTTDSNITFDSAVATTLMACEPDLMELETQYLNALAQASSYQVDGSILTLLDESGAAVASFTRLEPFDLTGTNWIVTSYNNGQDAVVGVLPDGPITASFRADGRMVGLSGCNLYSNNFNTADFQIDIQRVATTSFECPSEELALQEQLFLAAFGLVGNYTVLFDQMEFRSSDGTLAMTFDRAEDLSLTGTRWLLNSYSDGGGALVAPISGTEVDLNFTEDGSISGNAGCNNYGGGFQTTDGEISFSGVFQTEMACMDPAGAMEQESAYLSLLGEVASYQIQGNFLVLLNAEGQPILLFRAQLLQ